MQQVSNDNNVYNKLLFLFILEKYEMPITKENIFQICCIDNNWIPYLLIETIINELINSKMVIKKTNKDGDYYEITEDGHQCLSYFFEKIHKSTREEVKQYIRSEKLKYKIKQELVTRIELNQEGTYNVKCLIKKETQVLCEFTICNIPSKKKASQIAQLWPDIAPQIYKVYVDIQIDN